jgi:hypothetical protein
MIPQLGQCLILAATEAETNESIVPNWVKILITAGVFLIPYGLGVLLARSLRMKEYAFRITVVLFAATAGLMPFAYQAILGALEQQHYERQLAEYEAEKNEFQVTREALDALQKAHPRLKINRPADEAPPPEVSPVGEGE